MPRTSNVDLRASAGFPQNAKINIGHSNLNAAQTAPPVPAPSAQSTKTGTDNSQPGAAQTAPPVSNFDVRLSLNSFRLTPQQLQFLLRVSPAALESQRAYEIPACVTVAQAILESATAAGWGSSVLFRLANNPFGIKYEHFGAGCSVLGAGENPSSQQSAPSTLKPVARESGLGTPGSGQGKDESKFQIPNSGSPAPSAQHPAPSSGSPAPKPEDYGHFDAQTWEIENGQKKVMIAEFQRFPNLDEAFRAHALLLRSPRYRPAFDVRDDWKQFAERLGPKASPLDSEHCGYSTNPSYSAELVKLVSLYRLDDPRALQWFATGKDPGAQMVGGRS